MGARFVLGAVLVSLVLACSWAAIQALPSQFVSSLEDTLGSNATAVVQVDASTLVLTGWTAKEKVPVVGDDTMGLLLTKVRVDETGGLYTDWVTAFNGPPHDGVGDSTALFCMGEHLLQVEDGGYIVLGTTNTWGAGHDDILLGKFDSLGNVQNLWTIGKPWDDRGRGGIQRTRDGGILVNGFVRGFGTSPDSTNPDWFLCKFPPPSQWTESLQPEWAYVVTTIGTADAGVETECGAIEDTVGGLFYVMSGYTNTTDTTDPRGFDIRTVKLRYDSTQSEPMSTVWVTRIAATANGSGDAEGAGSLVRASDGRYVIAGGTRTGAFVGDNIQDAVVIKLEASNGDTVWARVLRTLGWDYFSSVLEQPDSTYLLGGWVGTRSGQRGFLLTCLDSSGSLKWKRCFNVSNRDMGEALIPSLSEAGYLQVGRSYPVHQPNGNYDVDILVAKYDTSGATCIVDTVAAKPPPQIFQFSHPNLIGPKRITQEDLVQRVDMGTLDPIHPEFTSRRYCPQ